MRLHERFPSGLRSASSFTITSNLPLHFYFHFTGTETNNGSCFPLPAAALALLPPSRLIPDRPGPSDSGLFAFPPLLSCSRWFICAVVALDVWTGTVGVAPLLCFQLARLQLFAELFTPAKSRV